ncbi:unnamed protein product [Prunus armeniaca]
MKLSGIIVNILKWDFWLKDGIAPVYHTLSLSRASLSLSSGSRPPPQPATFWPAVHSSGHHSGRDRSQNDRPDSAVLPHLFSDVSRQRYRRKVQKNGRFLPRFSGARSGDSGHQILRSRMSDLRIGFRPDFEGRFRPLPVSFWGTSKNKSDSKLGVLPRVGVLSRDLWFFRRCDIALDTHALPARVAARGHCS